MRIYPETIIDDLNKHPLGVETWVEVKREPGLIHKRAVMAGPWNESRYDCFCCSCDGATNDIDSACRNHGFWGRRECEVHNMPPLASDDGKVPELTVQKYIAKRKSNG